MNNGLYIWPGAPATCSAAVRAIWFARPATRLSKVSAVFRRCRLDAGGRWVPGAAVGTLGPDGRCSVAVLSDARGQADGAALVARLSSRRGKAALASTWAAVIGWFGWLNDGDITRAWALPLTGRIARPAIGS